MSRVPLAIAILLGAPIARADDGPTPATGMTSITGDPCDAIGALEPAMPSEHATCAVVAGTHLGAARVRLYALRNPDVGDDLTRRALVIDDGRARWLSPAIDVAGNGKLCNSWTAPIRARARLRRLSLDLGAAIALDLHVVNRANVRDPGRCTTIGYATWTRDVFLVCGPDADGGGWSCTTDDVGTWLGARCAASLDDRGVVTQTCTSRERLGLR